MNRAFSDRPSLTERRFNRSSLTERRFNRSLLTERQFGRHLSKSNTLYGANGYVNFAGYKCRCDLIGGFILNQINDLVIEYAIESHAMADMVSAVSNNAEKILRSEAVYELDSDDILKLAETILGTSSDTFFTFVEEEENMSSWEWAEEVLERFQDEVLSEFNNGKYDKGIRAVFKDGKYSVNCNGIFRTIVRTELPKIVGNFKFEHLSCKTDAITGNVLNTLFKNVNGKVASMIDKLDGDLIGAVTPYNFELDCRNFVRRLLASTGLSKSEINEMADDTADFSRDMFHLNATDIMIAEVIGFGLDSGINWQKIRKNIFRKYGINIEKESFITR